MIVGKNKWDKLINEHYLSACKNNKEYSKKHSKKEMKEWWYSLLEKRSEKDIEDFIKGSTHANNNGYFYHPV